VESLNAYYLGQSLVVVEAPNLLSYKLYNAFLGRIEGVVGATSYVFTGQKFSASLANDNIARHRFLSGKQLNAEPLGR